MDMKTIDIPRGLLQRILCILDFFNLKEECKQDGQ